MDLISIGEAARVLGMNASALRYYEERGLVVPVARRRGRRMYGRQELRRLVFLRTLQQLGISLDTAGAVLDAPGEEWRKAVGERIGELDELIARARAAQEVLRHALECPAEHPARECEFLVGMLDQLLDGRTFAEFAAGHFDDAG
ncbi:MerR family transcriptional regulator [Nonomuraea sp. B1E8]|uniref:MerR family transcriptional regulator n=1 Tax=unclassified Nonomuraea TaxID=2593643 RepID=UPI00325DEE49